MDDDEIIYNGLFVNIKRTELIINSKKTIMLQIIDISSSIMQDKYKALNQFNSMTNACVSHELRNPLNSIVAQNYEKRYLLERIKAILQNADSNNTE
jgi:signal transduction histidine kinase